MEGVVGSVVGSEGAVLGTVEGSVLSVGSVAGGTCAQAHRLSTRHRINMVAVSTRAGVMAGSPRKKLHSVTSIAEFDKKSTFFHFKGKGGSVYSRPWFILLPVSC